MKIDWEESDIVVGRKVATHHENAEQFMIGYSHSADNSDEESYNSEKRYVFISMIDGMVTHKYTKWEMAEQLTEEGSWPVEMIEVMKNTQK